jgi:hypothetical protein
MKAEGGRLTRPDILCGTGGGTLFREGVLGTRFCDRVDTLCWCTFVGLRIGPITVVSLELARSGIGPYVLSFARERIESSQGRARVS